MKKEDITLKFSKLELPGGVVDGLCIVCIDKNGLQIDEHMGDLFPELEEIGAYDLAEGCLEVNEPRETLTPKLEKLGFKIGERTVTIGKIENGDLRPSDKIVEKLEKELNIKLIEEVREISNISAGSQSGRGLTLGDFIKKEK